MMATKIPIHYNQLTASIKTLIASHGQVAGAVETAVEAHKRTRKARLDELRIKRDIQRGTEAQNAAIQTHSAGL